MHQFFTDLGIYSETIYQEMLEKTNHANGGDEQAQALISRYFNYIAVNIGFDGLFVKKSPRDIIEGYTDSKLSDLSTKDLYNGGDIRTDKFVQFGRGRTYPEGNQVAFFTGTKSGTPAISPE